jgi:c-di-GMP-binding flagellar brake protein YcgR
VVRESIEEVLFSLHLPTDVVFFKGSFRKGESGFFNARVKLPVFKTQRRQSMRLPLSGATVSFLLGNGKALDAELLNFSDGGIGISMREKKDFDLLSSMPSPVEARFSVHGIVVSAKLSIRHSTEFGTGSRKLYRAGMAFESIDPKLRERLSQIVLEESSKYLGRY